MTSQVFSTVAEDSTTQQDTPKATFRLRGHNPDVLTCIANLSNDEVFTPPELANEMLDVLEEAWADSNAGANIWADPSVTFLDPFTKSGVFLREIVTRLTKGLEHAFPDLQQRVDHILTKQVFGIGITRLTALLARRTVYCSKFANGKHSITDQFGDEDGNIWFERTEHTWTKRKREQRVHPTSGITEMVELEGTGRCKFCGANEANYSRDSQLETHAYAFIHTDDIKARMAELFGANMQFDVIIGNPPYQLDTGGAGRQAKPLYNLFVEQAKSLEPRFLVMIIQSRWFGGGMGLNAFRASMLDDKRLRNIVDFTHSGDVFPGTDFGGGVCYFLWNRDYAGKCVVENRLGSATYRSERNLNEFEHFIRYAPAVPILRKILAQKEPSLRSIVSSTRPFGIPTTRKPQTEGNLRFVSSKGTGRISSSEVLTGHEYTETWNVLLSKTSHDHAGLPDKNGQRRVFSRMELLEPNAVCSESYIVIGTFSDRLTATNCMSYLSTRFSRFLVSLLSYSQDITSGRFQYVPHLDFSREWSDSDLYSKYELTVEEIAFIESQIKPMELSDE